MWCMEEGDNIFCDATEMVTAGDPESNHGTALTTLHWDFCLWSGYLFSKINIYQGQQHQPWLSSCSLIIRLKQQSDSKFEDILKIKYSSSYSFFYLLWNIKKFFIIRIGGGGRDLIHAVCLRNELRVSQTKFKRVSDLSSHVRDLVTCCPHSDLLLVSLVSLSWLWQCHRHHNHSHTPALTNSAATFTGLVSSSPLTSEPAAFWLVTAPHSWPLIGHWSLWGSLRLVATCDACARCHSTWASQIIRDIKWARDKCVTWALPQQIRRTTFYNSFEESYYSLTLNSFNFHSLK